MMQSSSHIRIGAVRTALAALALMSTASVFAEDRPQSSLAVPGPDGKLTYPPYSEQGDRLPDFSWCGYRGGGVALPRLPVKVTLEPAANGDDAGRIQEAINQVSAMQPDKNGFRGAVLLKRGAYRVEKTLSFNQSGVVLRGEGDGEDGTIIHATKRGKHHVMMISGKGAPEEMANTKQPVLADYVPVGTRTFKVADTSKYKVGDNVMVCREGNQAWIDFIGMSKLSKGGDDKVKNWVPFTMKFQRVVLEVTPTTVTVDAPLVESMDTRWGGGYLIRYEFPGRIEHVGIDGIRCVSVYASPTDHAHAWRFVEINNAQNIWIQGCTALHLAYSMVEMKSTAKWVTVQDSKCLEMISEIKGGLRYPFLILGEQCLVQRCVASEGRHDFVMQYWVKGPNVFLDCKSINARSDSGPHQRYATGTLYDNVKTDRLNVVNRERSGSGHGWAGAQMVFWNCKARRMTVEKPPTAQNFSIGCTIGTKNGDGMWESVNKPVNPRSLYLKQLEDRLGAQAVKNIQP